MSDLPRLTPLVSEEPPLKCHRIEVQQPATQPVKGLASPVPPPLVRVKTFTKPPILSSPSTPSTSSVKSNGSQTGSNGATPVRSDSIVSFTSAQATSPKSPQVVSLHNEDTVTRWSMALTNAMMKHWPSDASAPVGPLMRKIASRVPGTPAIAAQQVRIICTAFQDAKNTKLRDEVMGEIMEIERLVRLNEIELMNPEMLARKESESVERNKSKDWSELKKAMQTSSDMFPCPKCHARDCMWEQRQTRSADEPMTVIASCNKCGFYWRKRG